eukprot:GHVQ01035401.1.p1 GENE.GHVQ01035401.1~~GHVQ01035401.1.p1  ORF type:complete len:364 (-),score=25.59 GHVQ01035401.1:1269-2360(-)
MYCMRLAMNIHDAQRCVIIHVYYTECCVVIYVHGAEFFCVRTAILTRSQQLEMQEIIANSATPQPWNVAGSYTVPPLTNVSAPSAAGGPTEGATRGLPLGGLPPQPFGGLVTTLGHMVQELNSLGSRQFKSGVTESFIAWQNLPVREELTPEGGFSVNSFAAKELDITDSPLARDIKRRINYLLMLELDAAAREGFQNTRIPELKTPVTLLRELRGALYKENRNTPGTTEISKEERELNIAAVGEKELQAGMYAFSNNLVVLVPPQPFGGLVTTLGHMVQELNSLGSRQFKSGVTESFIAWHNLPGKCGNPTKSGTIGIERGEGKSQKTNGKHARREGYRRGHVHYAGPYTVPPLTNVSAPSG